MPLTNNTRLGPYEILSPLGAGGMGEVYKARDTRLGRTVAIKVLPNALATDPQFRERFDLEARVVAGLTHPHICTVHDIGHQDGTDFIVMEYLQGETLEKRLERGAVPFDEALTIAIQVAGALDKAHRAGITHRDLKPANVMLTKAGAKLLDFGLAKTRVSAVAGVDLSVLPTTPAGLTATGTILGTFQYMAPEQIEGKEADARTDIFAFGSVLYEMFTGQNAFTGKTPAGLFAAILKDEPTPISAVQPMTPAVLSHLVQVCLAKDPDDRWQTAGDLRRELKWITEVGSLAGAPGVVERRNRRERLPWIIAAGSVMMVAMIAWLAYSRLAPAEIDRVTLSVALPEGQMGFGGSFALSPDGRYLAFAATGADGRISLWVRPLDTLTARRLPETDDAAFPFWAPDGRFIAFFAGGKLKKIAVAGEAAQTLADAPQGRGGSWSPAGIILFTPDNGALYRVSDSGGAAAPATTLDTSRQELGHRWPSFLPDGQHFFYTVQSGLAETRGLYLGSLDSKKATRLLSVYANGVYAQGALLFVNEGLLMAQALDVNQARFSRDATRVAEHVGYNRGLGYAAISASTTGVLAYRAGGSVTNQLQWFDRNGKSVGPVGPDENSYDVSLSPDQKKIALCFFFTSTADIWLVELARGVTSRMTSNPATDRRPTWSPDGAQLVFASNRDGQSNLYREPSTGSGEANLLLKTGTDKFPTDWSLDGRFLLYTDMNLKTRADVWMLPMAGDPSPTPVMQTEFNEWNAQLSPDGHWVAYTSDESGRAEVYVQSFPVSGKKLQISADGGTEPRWRRDGRELFYVAANRMLMVVTVTSAPTFGLSRPMRLFDARLDTSIGNFHSTHYAVSADGQRFLMNVATDSSSSPIAVALNWKAGLRK